MANTWMAGCPDQAWCSQRHLATEALWALMHINEIGYVIPRQKHWFATPPFNRFTKMSPVVKVVSKTVKNWSRYLVGYSGVSVCLLYSVDLETVCVRHINWKSFKSVLKSIGMIFIKISGEFQVKV